MAQISYRFAYVSGAFFAFPGNLMVNVANVGPTEGVVQVLGFDRHKQVIDSMINVVPEPPIPYSPDGHVKPGETWTYVMDTTDFSSPFRLVIRTTNDRLVPSAELIPFDDPDGGPTGRNQIVCWPTDFVVFPLHLDPVGPLPTPAPPEQ